MKRALLPFLLTGLLIACARNPVRGPDSHSPGAIRHIFEVVAWVDDPNPDPGARVMLYGSLIKDGVNLGGMAMRATWPDDDQERGVPNCSVQVIYGSGVCIIETQNYKSGDFIPVTIAFEYQGQVYSGQTGFRLK